FIERKRPGGMSKKGGPPRRDHLGLGGDGPTDVLSGQSAGSFLRMTILSEADRDRRHDAGIDRGQGARDPPRQGPPNTAAGLMSSFFRKVSKIISSLTIRSG